MDVKRDDLLLQKVANCDVFVGKGISTSWGRLYGGQTLGQSMIASAATVDNNFPIHSLHAYFILAGDCNKEILFEVERVRDGGSFKTRSCHAKQDGKTIMILQSSFHKVERGVDYQLDIDLLVLPYKLPNVDEIDLTDDGHYFNRSGFSNIHRHQIVHDGSETTGASFEVCLVRVDKNLMPEEWKRSDLTKEDIEKQARWRVQTGLLAFICDNSPVPMMRLSHPQIEFNMARVVSLDHSMHFHHPCEIDVFDWMWFYAETKSTSIGRGLATLHVFNSKKKLVATATQEALLTPKSKV